MLLVFQMFFQTPVISRIEFIGGGRAGGRGWGEAGRVGSQSNHSDSKSSGVPSVCGTNCYNAQRRPRLVRGAAWYPVQSYDAPQGHEMHPRGFTASIKSRL